MYWTRVCGILPCRSRSVLPALTSLPIRKIQNAYYVKRCLLDPVTLAQIFLNYIWVTPLSAEWAKYRKSRDFATCNLNDKSHQSHLSVLSDSLQKSKISWHQIRTGLEPASIQKSLSSLRINVSRLLSHLTPPWLEGSICIWAAQSLTGSFLELSEGAISTPISLRYVASDSCFEMRSLKKSTTKKLE